MKLGMKIALCVFLVLFAAASLLAVLASLGVLPERAEAAGAESAYELRAWDGYVAVFCPPDAAEPVTRTDIRLRDLPLHDRLSLTAGLPAEDYGDVVRLLEDFGS